MSSTWSECKALDPGGRTAGGAPGATSADAVAAAHANAAAGGGMLGSAFLELGGDSQSIIYLFSSCDVTNILCRGEYSHQSITCNPSICA